MEELKTLKIKTTLNDGNKPNMYLHFIPLEKEYKSYSKTGYHSIISKPGKELPPFISPVDLKQELQKALKKFKYGDYIFETLYNDTKYLFMERFGKEEKKFIDVIRNDLKIFVDYKIISPLPTHYINDGIFKPNIYFNENLWTNINCNYTPGTNFTNSGFGDRQLNGCRYSNPNRKNNENSFDIHFTGSIFDSKSFDFNNNAFTNDTKYRVNWFVDLTYTYSSDGNVLLYFYIGVQHVPGIDFQNSLNDFLGTQPPQTNTFTIRTKMEGYPGFLLPESLPCKIYEGQTFIKDVVLLKANRYQTQEELESTKKYTAKLDTAKIPKKFLERTKIQPPTITDEGWTYQLNLKCTNSDPYPGGGSEGGGGEGGLTPGGSGTIDGVPIPLPPAFGLTDTGLVTLFSPTRSQIHALGQALWTPTFFQKISKMFADPMDAILGLNLLPLKVASGTAKEIVVGNVGTGVHCNVCGQQYMFFSVGTINIPKKYDSYLDYAPFTKVEIFLPFIGFRTLNTDEVMDTTITVTYQVDVLTGQCNATLFNNKGLMFACFSGNCATTIPLSGRDFTGVFRSAITVATAVGLGVATGGASLLEGGAGSVASSVSSMKPSIQRSGSVSGATAMLTTRTPYVLVERPNACIPKNQNVIEGYPSFVTKQLSECRGYTSVQSVELEGLSNATEEEKTEVVSMLKGGVYL